MKQSVHIFLKREVVEIFNALADLLGIGIIFFTSEGKELVTGIHRPVCGFCETLTNKFGFEDQCRKADLEKLWKSRKSEELVCFSCFAGLYDAVMPIHNESPAAYVQIGHFRLTEGFEPDDHGINKLSKDGIKKLREKFYQVSFFDHKELNNVLNLFNVLISYCLSHRLLVIKPPDSVPTIIEYINAHITENLTLDQASQLVHRSKSSLSHLFKEQTGKSLIQYQIHKKLEYAEKLLLQEREMSIKNIAFRLGYSDQLYFSKLFRLKYGLSPLNFRNKYSDCS